MKPSAGSGGGGGVELKETVKRDRMGKKKRVIRERPKSEKEKMDEDQEVRCIFLNSCSSISHALTIVYDLLQ
jgi:hypothetical protein